MLSLLPTHNRCQCCFTIPYVMLLIQSLKNGERFHYFPSVSWLLISSLRKKRVGFKQDERELFWGFRHEKELTRDLSGLFPLRFLFLRQKKKKYLLALKSYMNHHHHRNLELFHQKECLKIPKFSVLNVNNTPPAGHPQATISEFMVLGDIKKDQFRFHSFAKCRPFWSNTVRAISSGLLFA